MTAGMAEVVGANVRQLRKRHGWTLDQLAQEMQGYGFNWSTGRLGDIEAGRGAIRLETLAGLAVVLDASVPDLLASDGGLRLNDTLALSPKQWSDLLGGKQIFLAPTVRTTGLTLSDARAIKRLGITSTSYETACMELWGHAMSQEVEIRAGSTASPQQRGQLTRHLQRVLQEHLEFLEAAKDRIDIKARPCGESRHD